MAYQGKYIGTADLVTRITAATFVQIFDDDNVNDPENVNDLAVQQVVDGAEAEVESYLITERSLPMPATTNPTVDRLVRMSCLDFAEALCFLRHPEYVRTYGDNPKAQALWERASERMERVKQGRQELPDQDRQNPKPLNTSSVVLDEGPRTITTSSDGTENGSGF